MLSVGALLLVCFPNPKLEWFLEGKVLLRSDTELSPWRSSGIGRRADAAPDSLGTRPAGFQTSRAARSGHAAGAEAGLSVSAGKVSASDNERQQRKRAWFFIWPHKAAERSRWHGARTFNPFGPMATQLDGKEG